MKNPPEDVLRSSLSGLFDIQQEPDSVIVTAPLPLSSAFREYLLQHKLQDTTMQVPSDAVPGEDLVIRHASADQVVGWVDQFAHQLDEGTVEACYHAIFPPAPGVAGSPGNDGQLKP